MKKICKIVAGFLALAALAAGCRTPMEEITEVAFGRVLTPLRFSAEVVASKGTDVTFSWQLMNGAEAYILEVYPVEEGVTVDPESAAGKQSFTVSPDEVPYTVAGLTVDKSFMARVQAVSEKADASHWAYLEQSVSTRAVRSSLNPVVKTRETTSVTITWDKAADAADLSTVQVEPVLPQGEEKPVKVDVTSDELAACEKTLSGLDAGRQYRFTLFFGKAGDRGSVVAFTRPNIDGSATAVASAAEVLAATDNAAGPVVLKVAYGAAPLDIKSLYPSESAKYVTVKNDLTIYGVPADDGRKPVLSGFAIQADAGAGKIHLEDLSLDGQMLGLLITNAKAALTSIEIINCEVSNYEKGIFTQQTSGGSFQSLLVEGCYMHDINAAGTATGDFIDVRQGENGSITLKHSTFYALARTFIRVSDSAKNIDAVTLEGCTLNYVTTTTSSSNNNGIFHVRINNGLKCKTILCKDNVFLNMVSDGETAEKGWVRMARDNASENLAPDCSGNVYFNMGPFWWETRAVGAPGNANAGQTFTAYISSYDAEKKVRTLNEEGGLLLDVDPCINSAAGKMYLTGDGGAAIIKQKAGDPRWWDAVMPEVVRETELKAVSSDYTWNFTEKTIYDTETLSATTIIGNARIFATEAAPAEVVMSQGVTLPAAVVGADGVPSCGGVEVLTSGYGSVKVKAESADGYGSVQVLAGGDRYPVLADGQVHTVVLGDLVGENSIYVISDGRVTLKSVAWTTKLDQDVTVITLATPSVTATPAKLDEGTSEDVTFSWAAVDNAADYEVTWKGAATVQTETSFTVAAADVAALKAGVYTLGVVARPVATSSKYVASAAGEAKLTVEEVVSGVTQKTLVWDFTADQFTAACATTKNYKYDAGAITETASMTETEVLYFVNGDKAIKGVGKKTCSGDQTDYYPFTYGGATCYGVIRTDKAGTMKIVASQAKEASENKNCTLGLKIGGAVVGTDVALDPYDLSKPVCGAKEYSWEITNTTGGVQEIQIVKVGGSTSPWVFRIEFTYEVSAAQPKEYRWNFTEDQFTAACATTKNYKYDAGAITETASMTETEVLYFVNGDKAIKGVGKKTCSGDQTDYYPFTYGGATCYGVIRTDKAGTMKIVASQAKEASENKNCTLGLKIGGAVVGTDAVLDPYDLSKPVCGAKEYSWEITNTTGGVQEIQIVKVGGSTSPWVFEIVFTEKL